MNENEQIKPKKSFLKRSRNLFVGLCIIFIFLCAIIFLSGKPHPFFTQLAGIVLLFQFFTAYFMLSIFDGIWLKSASQLYSERRTLETDRRKIKEDLQKIGRHEALKMIREHEKSSSKVSDTK